MRIGGIKGRFERRERGTWGESKGTEEEEPERKEKKGEEERAKSKPKTTSF